MLAAPSGGGTKTNGTVTMFPGNGSIVHAITAQASSVAGTTRVLENNAVVTTLVCTAEAGGACPFTLQISDTDGNYYKVSQETGAAADGSLIWWRKENLHGALNPAYLGSCDPHVPLQSTERVFTVDSAGAALKMANGSCLWSDEVTSPGVISVGACTSPHGGWTWKGAVAKGDAVHTASSKCLVPGARGIALGPCGSTPWSQQPAGDGDASHVYLSATGGCVVAVPDNNNNTLGVALGVADATGGLVKGKAARISATDPSAGTALSLSLKSGEEYSLIVGLQTLRDIGCAGIRPQWETCTTTPQAAAAALVTAMAKTVGRAAAVKTSDAFWDGYWAASSIDLTAGTDPNSTSSVGIVERWYYLSQYLLAR